jgi:hypothetical protein
MWYLFNFVNAKGARMYTNNGKPLREPNTIMGGGMNMNALCQEIPVVNTNMSHDGVE